MRRRIATVLALLAVGAIAVVGTGASDDEAKGKQLKIAFDNAFGLTEGGDMRVGGVRAGKTQEFKTSTGPECQTEESKTRKLAPRTCAIVVVKITEKGYRSFRKDAHCDIRQQSLIGEYYVDCQPGSDQQELESDEPITVQNTTSTVPADLVGNVMRRPYRERLRLILAELGTGLAGRPEDLAEVLERAHPGLRETRKVLRILGDQKQIIRDFIGDSDTVVAELDDKKREVQRWIAETGETAEISASRRDAIAAGFQRLPRFLDELKPTMAELEELADAQTPLLKDLQRAAPSLTEFFTRLGPFSEASRPAFRSLGETADVGVKAFNESKDEVDQLRKLADAAPALGKPLRQFLQTSDDAKRAADGDPRAEESAPPAPDKNSNAAGPRRGFTAMEALLNYIYWQTLAINQFDETSHILRTANFILEDCSDIQNDLRVTSLGGSAEQQEIREKCGSYLGPYNPGVMHEDPTDPDGGRLGFPEGQNGGSSGGQTGSPRIAKTLPSKPGERRGAGEPAALPLPGQFDPSVPHVTLPPALQQIVDGLQGGGAPSGASGAQADQLLDFLLAP